ncbi:MAG: RNA polymerase factor sigma-54 [Verrucomicrobia bacterium]|nr:RNA polymerase factor sigma-54 [Verrucomicrobiota bacterium]
MPGPALTQSLSQQQKLSPQMQQSLQVLQVPTLELRQLVQQEISENPVLEDESNDISLEQQKEDDARETDSEIEALTQLDEDWRDYMQQLRRNSGSSTDQDARRQFLFDSLVEPVTLQEHLMAQLSTADEPPETRELAEMLIGNIDDRGFLQIAIGEFSLTAGIPLVKLQAAKALIQSFDPVGVGSEDLRECLLIQLKRLGKEFSLEYRIVSSHLDDLARKRYPQIAKRLSVTIEQVSGAAEMIATLNPKPGGAFSSTPDFYIVPDVTVEWDGTKWVPRLNEEHIPRLRISNTYKEILSNSTSDTAVRSYIRDKIRGGKFLIKSIHQRQETIQNIVQEIVGRQTEFMEHGKTHLRPMNMAQVAEQVGVHETTVSRAISGKYMATPHGMFEMKYFFTSGYETDSGESMSNTSIKNALADVVKNEDHKSPLSDQKLVEKLKEQGINIARRTVAKYREELNILPSHLRKSY